MKQATLNFSAPSKKAEEQTGKKQATLAFAGPPKKAGGPLLLDRAINVGSLNIRSLSEFCKNVQLTSPMHAISSKSTILGDFMDGQDLDVLSLVEVRGGDKDWIGESTFKGLEKFAMNNYNSYWSKGTGGYEGVGIVIKKDIPHKEAYVDPPGSGLKLPSQFKGRLLVLETEFPSRIAFVAIYGLTKDKVEFKEKKEIKVKKDAFIEHVGKVVKYLTDNGARPVLLGDFNITPDNKDLFDKFGPNLTSVFGEVDSPRHTYFSNYFDEVAQFKENKWNLNSNFLANINVAKLNIERGTGACVDYIYLDTALTLIPAETSMCGCGVDCPVPCPVASHARMANLLLTGLHGEAAATHDAQLTQRFNDHKLFATKNSSLDTNQQKEYRDFLEEHYMDDPADPAFHAQKRKKTLTQPAVWMQFPFNHHNHALLRYLPPWATDHMLVHCRIISGEAAAAAGAGAVGISGEAAAAAGAGAVGKRKRSND